MKKKLKLLLVIGILFVSGCSYSIPYIVAAGIVIGSNIPSEPNIPEHEGAAWYIDPNTPNANYIER